MIETAPAALQLRFLQTMNEISEENATFAFLPLPMDFLEAFKKRDPSDLIRKQDKGDDKEKNNDDE